MFDLRQRINVVRAELLVEQFRCKWWQGSGSLRFRNKEMKYVECLLKRIVSNYFSLITQPSRAVRSWRGGILKLLKGMSTGAFPGVRLLQIFETCLSHRVQNKVILNVSNECFGKDGVLENICACGFSFLLGRNLY